MPGVRGDWYSLDVSRLRNLAVVTCGRRGFACFLYLSVFLLLTADRLQAKTAQAHGQLNRGAEMLALQSRSGCLVTDPVVLIAGSYLTVRWILD